MEPQTELLSELLGIFTLTLENLELGLGAVPGAIHCY